MAVTQDGSQQFGISEDLGLTGLVVESFTLSQNGNRIDLNNGDGEPLGAAITIGRTEFTATVQLGEGTEPSIGDTVTLSSGFDTTTTGFITSIEKTETAADYQRLNIGGYLKINSGS